MKKTTRAYRFTLLGISALLIVALLVSVLPQATQAASSAATTTGTFSTSIRNGKVYITTSGYTGTEKFMVKVRNGGLPNPKWFKQGVLKPVKTATQTNVYALPKALFKVLYVQVCLKNQKNDRLSCKIALNPGY
jgi:hypothetical protein